MRLWDLSTARCRLAFRGHVDSVNEVCWQPFTNNFATGSSDKTVSLWDMRTGLCAQTLYGHLNSVNHLAFNTAGDVIASCDADGLVKLWDVRMVAEMMSVDCGPHAANKVAFDRASETVAVASDDGTVKCFGAADGDSSPSCEGTRTRCRAFCSIPTDSSWYRAPPITPSDYGVKTPRRGGEGSRMRRVF